MDPGMLGLVTLLAPVVASAAAVITVVATVYQYVNGHGRGDHSGLIQALVSGGMATGIIYTAPRWIPAVIAAVSAIGI